MDIMSVMPKKEYDIDSLLPLQSSTFYILMALGDGEMHGYAIIQDVAARTGGEVKLSAGTLYRSIQRMQEQGLIIESRRRPVPEEDDERRRYYKITDFGSAVIRAELRRLTSMIRLARVKGFVPEKA
jgi:DNA-binding PadR family transcriptional regulator